MPQACSRAACIGFPVCKTWIAEMAFPLAVDDRPPRQEPWRTKNPVRHDASYLSLLPSVCVSGGFLSLRRRTGPGPRSRLEGLELRAQAPRSQVISEALELWIPNTTRSLLRTLHKGRGFTTRFLPPRRQGPQKGAEAKRKALACAQPKCSPATPTLSSTSAARRAQYDTYIEIYVYI